MIRLQRDLCRKCGLCLKACAFGAICLLEGYPDITEGCVLCGNCARQCPPGALVFEEARPKADTAAYRGFWVVGLEDDPDKLSKVSQELLSEARRLADKRGEGGRVTLAVFGEAAGRVWREEAQSVGCDAILLLEGAGAHYNVQGYTQVLTEAIEEYRPEAVLFPATADGRDFAPRVACRLRTGLTADCTGLDIDFDGNLMQIRPTYGGSIMATILTPERRPQMASVRPNVMKIQKREGRKSKTKVERFKSKQAGAARQAERIASEISVSAYGNLDEATVIIAGGYGLGSKENFEKIYRLSNKLNACAAATRKAVDEGWAPAQIQVGQTGKTVDAEIYLAFGISGALQHTLGMKNSAKIIAVNNDPAAPIFRLSDVSILGDANKVLDALLEAF